MIPFEYQRAHDITSAVAAVAGKPNAAFLGGGTNLVDHMKLGVTNPTRLVDITHLPLSAVEDLPDGGVRIGAEARNSDVAADPTIRSRYPVLSEALLAGASGQLRNLATTGGNLLQRTRCGYFQDITTPCNKREPGSGCSALSGHTRYHAIFGGSPECVATHPSDMAVALTALDATVQVQGPDGPRSVPIGELYRLPGDHPERDTVLGHGDLITSVDLPPPRAVARSTYWKIRDRASYAFALVSVAAVLSVVDEAVVDVRLSLGGVAHKPWRASTAEQALLGASPAEDAFSDAAEQELANAEPLAGNAFKVPMTRNAIVGALRETSGR